jgi:hypothetical protein
MPITTRIPLRFTLFSLPFGGTYPILEENFGEYREVAAAALNAIEILKKNRLPNTH